MCWIPAASAVGFFTLFQLSQVFVILMGFIKGISRATMYQQPTRACNFLLRSKSKTTNYIALFDASSHMCNSHQIIFIHLFNLRI
jgi:hypothetical protein